MLSVAVSHDGQWVVSGSKDRGVQFWDSRTAIVQCMLQGHKNSGTCSTSYRATHVLTLTFPIFTVISIDLSPAGNVLATGSGDWQARICASPLPFYFEKLPSDVDRVFRELQYHIMILVTLRSLFASSCFVTDVSSVVLIYSPPTCFTSPRCICLL